MLLNSIPYLVTHFRFSDLNIDPTIRGPYHGTEGIKRVFMEDLSRRWHVPNNSLFYALFSYFVRETLNKIYSESSTFDTEKKTYYLRNHNNMINNILEQNKLLR